MLRYCYAKLLPLALHASPMSAVWYKDHCTNNYYIHPLSTPLCLAHQTCSSLVFGDDLIGAHGKTPGR
jgi:hypothetical protein